MSLQGVLLALLSSKPDSGYGLSRRLRTELSHLWEARIQQVYVELAKLERRGCVRAQLFALANRPPKKIYALTPAGERALAEWLAIDPGRSPARDERLMRVYCLRLVPRELLLHRLRTWRDGWNQDVEKLRRRSALISRTDPSELGPLLAHEAALARAEAEVSWCSRALGILNAPDSSEESQGLERRDLG